MIAKSVWYGVGEEMWLSMFFKDGSLTTILYRIMFWCNKRWFSFFSKIISELIFFLSGAVIGRKVCMGLGFVLVHTNGVVINNGVVGGENIIIQHGVTIGEEKGGVPRLGNNIFIGAGAKIFGDITIGDGVRIGANAVINFDVAAGKTVVGAKARYV